jgi:NADH-quinone oxidoreductase subunit C
MSADLVSTLQARFPRLAPRPSADHPAVNAPLEDVVPLLRCLRDEHGFDLLTDVTAIDWAPGASPRFTVVYHLLSTTRAGAYVRVAAPGGGAGRAHRHGPLGGRRLARARMLRPNGRPV